MWGHAPCAGVTTHDRHKIHLRIFFTHAQRTILSYIRLSQHRIKYNLIWYEWEGQRHLLVQRGGILGGGGSLQASTGAAKMEARRGTDWAGSLNSLAAAISPERQWGKCRPFYLGPKGPLLRGPNSTLSVGVIFFFFSSFFFSVWFLAKWTFFFIFFWWAALLGNTYFFLVWCACMTALLWPYIENAVAMGRPTNKEVLDYLHIISIYIHNGGAEP